MRLAVAGIMILALSRSSFGSQDPSALVESTFHRIHLKNGNVLEGTVFQEDAKGVVLGSMGGTLTISRSQIDWVELVKVRRTAGEEPARKSTPRPAGENGARRSEDGPPALPAQREGTGPRGPGAYPSGVSLKIRQRVDTLLAPWKSAPDSERPKIVPRLSDDLVALGREPVPYLLWLLAERRAGLPVEAICAALGRLGDPRAIPVLGLLLHAPKPEDRYCAVAALALMESRDTVNLLLKALNDETVEVWRTASTALVREFSVNDDAMLVGTVIKEMAHARAKTPHAVTLGRMGTPEAHQALRYLLDEGNEQDRIAAFQGLALLCSPEDGILIHRYLLRRSPNVQKEACLVLGRLQYRPAVPDLIGLLQEEDSGLKHNAHWALKEITGQSMSDEAPLWEKWWEGTQSQEKK
jgi:hypothetical protein